MPDWAFCGEPRGHVKPGCGLLRLDVPGVRDMVIERIPQNRVGEAPRCECAEVDRLEARRRFGASGVPHQLPGEQSRRLDNFEIVDGSLEAHSAAETFCHSPKSVILTLVGRTGSGKSHLAESVCREVLGQGRTARYEYVPRLLDAMRATYNKTDGEDQMEAIMLRCINPALLALDDIGREKASEWTSERLTAIVEERLGAGRRTMFTTNKTREQIAESYAALASRMWSEGSGEARVIVMECGDYRVE